MSILEVPSSIRELLKEPFSGLCPLDSILSLSKSKRLVGVGDAVVLSTLKAGIKPFVAVYDFVNERKSIEASKKGIISSAYPKAKTLPNPAHHFNTALLPLAKHLMKEGGALFIEGEEDLAGLAFMAYAEADHLIYYGLRNQGIVAISGLKARAISRYILEMLGVNLED